MLKGGDAGPAPWVRAIPDTMGEGYFLFVCQKYDPKKHAISDTPAKDLWKDV